MKKYLQIESILASEPDPAFKRRAKIIFQNLNLRKSENILEVGCGRGFYTSTLSKLYPSHQVCGVDISRKYLSVAKKKIKKQNALLIQADAEHLPFSNNTFNRIIISEVLEHLTEDQKALSEIFRVLKPNGIVLITVPNKDYPFLWDPINWLLERFFGTHVPSHVWWLAGIWADHDRLYTKDKLTKRIIKANFAIEKQWESTHYCFPFSHFLLYGIGKNLVEMKIIGDDLNRFVSKAKPSLLTRIIQAPFYFFDRFNSDTMPNKSVVNLIVKAKKKNNYENI